MKFRMFLATICCGVVGLSVEATSFAASSPATASQVQTAIRSAISNDRQPTVLNPTLASLATGPTPFTGSSLADKCSPRLHTNYRTKPIPCMFGATRGSVWVLWGDSHRRLWIPALDIAARLHKVRLAVFVFPGCKSRLIDGSDSGFVDKVNACRSWHAALPAAVSKLKPSVVFSAELADGFSGQQGDVAALAAQWKTAFDTVAGTSASVKRVLLEPTPNLISPSGLRRAVPACLSVAANKGVLSCSSKITNDVWTAGNYWTYLMASRASAVAAGATSIPVSQLFCSTAAEAVQSCPVVIGQYVVFADEDHVTKVYMTYVGSAFNELLVAKGI